MLLLYPQLRTIEAVAAFETLEKEFDDWLTPKESEQWDAHRTQLNSIGALIRGLIGDLKKDADALSDLAPTVLYEQARNLEVSVMWLRRLWDFLRAPFDQRDAGRFFELLQAADEVAWSCYSIPFEITGQPRGCAPLTFIESRFSPAAFPREAVPSGLGEEMGRFHALNRMPLGLLRLPPSAASAPWWLVLIGHEAGHHVQFDLLPGRKMDDLFGDGLFTAVEKVPNMTQADQYRWKNWSQEIFADMFSLCCMGPAALQAMLELELRPAARMDNFDQQFYPPPSVRLRLIAHALDELMGGSGYSDAIESYAPRTAPIESLISAIPAVVKFALGPLPEIGEELTTITGFDPKEFGQQGSVTDWKGRYWQTPYGSVDTDPHMPRLLASAAMEAYSAAGGSAELNLLANRVVEVIGQSRSPGERGAETMAAEDNTAFAELRRSIRIASGLTPDVS